MSLSPASFQPSGRAGLAEVVDLVEGLGGGAGSGVAARRREVAIHPTAIAGTRRIPATMPTARQSGGDEGVGLPARPGSPSARMLRSWTSTSNACPDPPALAPTCTWL